MDEGIKNFSFVRDKVGGMGLPRSPATIDVLVAKHNVGLVVSMTEYALPDEYLAKHVNGNGGLQYVHVPTRDFGVPDPAAMHEAIVKAQVVEQQLNKAVVFHCRAGVGRTGTALACYLVQVDKMAPEEAINLVRAKRPGSLETTEQVEFVKAFQ